jgi:intracellular sulfur oxidation DsrE/DsrF family protein
MRQITIIVFGFVTGLLIAVGMLWYQGQNTVASELPATASSPAQSPGFPLSSVPSSSRVVVDSANTKVEELLQLLNDASQRAANDSASPVPFVLHGEEIRYFTRQQFEAHRELVDLAAELDASMVVEVKACRTTMQMLGIEDSDLPGFVELVPYGPDEVERLGSEGYDIYTAF